MRVLMGLGILLWLAAWTYAGYQMTGTSFAWLDKVKVSANATDSVPAPFSLPVLPKIPTSKAEAVQMYQNLKPTQKDCLVHVATADQIASAEQGKMPYISPAQMSAFAACLK